LPKANTDMTKPARRQNSIFISSLKRNSGTPYKNFCPGVKNWKCLIFYLLLSAVLRVRIRIHMFLGLLELSLSKNSEKNLVFYCFVTSFWLFIFEVMWMYLQKDPRQNVMDPQHCLSGFLFSPYNWFGRVPVAVLWGWTSYDIVGAGKNIDTGGKKIKYFIFSQFQTLFHKTKKVGTS